MIKFKWQYQVLICLLFLFNGCTPPLLQCFLKFSNFEKTYEFAFSKEELKNRIVDVYTYDESLFLKNFGLTLIEEEKINSEYRKSVVIYLDKKNWDDFKSEIRTNTTDTLNLLIGKHHSRKHIKVLAIIKEENQKAFLTISQIEYRRRRACRKDEEYYLIRISNKIEKKLINKLIQ